MLAYTEARAKVIEVVSARCGIPRSETVAVVEALGRVLAEPVVADRDYPPFDRSTRDGFAVRATDGAAAPVELRCIGEAKAGVAFAGEVGPGQCVQIMTGAPVPVGADAVVMLEHATVAGDRVTLQRTVQPGQNLVPRGREARAGQVLMRPGARLGFAELALAAQVGSTELRVFRRPRVAILSTGDEVVPVDAHPGPFEIRNSNSIALAAQARLVGAEPVLLGNAPDREDRLQQCIERGLREHVLVLSGGVSAGKYDLVEAVLERLGMVTCFDAVRIRPGRPAVFGVCGETFVFGLPGNPVSTMVTFELFVVPALDRLSGASARPLATFRARLAAPVRQRAELTHFLPAEVRWEAGEPVVRELPWQGSGDIVAMAQANAFLLVPETRLEWGAGEWVDVLPRRDCL
jgi:molybdopterin molybdotransferase